MKTFAIYTGLRIFIIITGQYYIQNLILIVLFSSDWLYCLAVPYFSNTLFHIKKIKKYMPCNDNIADTFLIFDFNSSY